MSERACETAGTLPSQDTIRDNCFQPSVEFIEFKKAGTEQSISARFEKQVSRYPDRIAIRTQGQEISYTTLNRRANRIAREFIAQRGNDREPVGFERLGEIAVRSRYLAQGHWRQPELTRAAFLPDPAGKDKRICLTGDLGLMRADGCLEHHGRKDSQVKIREHRVEATEVEMTLLAHNAVKETVVVVQDVPPGEKCLVAYVTAAGAVVPAASELRDWLGDRLPTYMVPSRFILLDALPLTSSGKVDRLALSKAAGTSLEPVQEFVAPRTPAEEILANIWARVLNLRQVSVYDNFFELGGNSLLATQVTSRLRDLFQVELPLPTFFEGPTITELAKAVEEVRAGGTGVQGTDLMPLSRDWCSTTSATPGDMAITDSLPRGEY